MAAPYPVSTGHADTAGRGGPGFSRKHLLGIADLSPYEILDLLDRAERMIPVSRQERKVLPTLSGKTQINLFFESSTRTQGSFEIAGKRLGAQVMNMSVKTSSVTKGETLIDTAATQALLDALTIRRHKGRLTGLTVAICGDIANSRVARSNLLLLGALQIRTRVIAPRTLLPRGIENMATEVFTDMEQGLEGADVVMMLRLQHERAAGKMIPSVREYYRFYGLDAEKLAYAKPDAIVMHPGPMNRGVEIDPAIADSDRSVITDQVEMGVAVRMAVLEALLPDRNEAAS